MPEVWVCQNGCVNVFEDQLDAQTHASETGHFVAFGVGP